MSVKRILIHKFINKKRWLCDFSKCPRQVNGIHEPNVILKDNDLRYRLNLPKSTSQQVLAQLQSDAEFLSDTLGVMDYSLLVGVRKTEFLVDEEEDFDQEEINSPRRRTVSSATTISNNASSGDTSLRSSQPQRPLLGCNNRLLTSRVVAPESFNVGIVDYQQTYNFRKKVIMYTATPLDLSIYSLFYALYESDGKILQGIHSSKKCCRRFMHGASRLPQ